MTSLTPRQSDALSFIASFHAEKGFGPSYREIADGIGLNSKSGVFRIVNGLEERGAIRRLSDRARSIEVIADGAEYHLRAVLASFSKYSILFEDAPSVIEAKRYLERGSQ